MKRNPVKAMPDLAVLKSIIDYDQETGLFTWKNRTCEYGNHKAWNTKYSGKTAGRKNDHTGYIEISIFDSRYRANRLAWFYSYGEDPKEFVIDHKDGVKDNNKLSNLRKTTYSGNSHNKGAQKNNKSSGIKGVHYNKRDKRYNACISVNKESKYLGSFILLEDARKAVEQAFMKYESEIFDTNLVGAEVKP